MILLPWLGFGLAIFYMIYQGFKSKNEFLAAKQAEAEGKVAAERAEAVSTGMHVGPVPAAAYNQSQSPDPGKTFGFAARATQGK